MQPCCNKEFKPGSKNGKSVCQRWFLCKLIYSLQVFLLGFSIYLQDLTEFKGYLNY